MLNTYIMLGYIDPGLGGLIVQSLIAGCFNRCIFLQKHYR